MNNHALFFWKQIGSNSRRKMRACGSCLSFFSCTSGRPSWGRLHRTALHSRKLPRSPKSLPSLSNHPSTSRPCHPSYNTPYWSKNPHCRRQLTQLHTQRKGETPCGNLAERSTVAPISFRNRALHCFMIERAPMDHHFSSTRKSPWKTILRIYKWGARFLFLGCNLSAITKLQREGHKPNFSLEFTSFPTPIPHDFVCNTS